MKRRSDKQYHSDDGYTSDPGQIREEEDDETDGDREVDSTYVSVHLSIMLMAGSLLYMSYVTDDLF